MTSPKTIPSTLPGTSAISPARRFTPGRIALFLLLVTGLFAWQGNLRVATGPAEGDSFNGPAPASRPAGDTLRIAQFNIAGGVGKADNRLDLDRTAAAIKGYDLVALEEIHGPGILGGKDQAQILGEKLALPWLFAPTERRWGHDDFGNGAITSLPVSHWQRFRTSSEDAASNRNLLLLRVQFSVRPVNVIITHIDRHDDRPHELRSVIELFNSLAEPAILIGDLNSEPTDPQIAALRKMPGVSDAVGDALGDKLGGNVDWIFARGMRVVKSGTTDNGASDHYLAWAHLQVYSGH